ncbi:MAG: 3-isopropylmalate dehydratase small subunit [marine bacterium B5-7]|nr:MAG: 3-isopropylmalate dehydratase small subunit [marine bacterium B5-7]
MSTINNRKTAITQIKGQCVPMMIDDVDTDIIIPAQRLTQTTQSGYGQHAFARLKQADENFVLNQSKYDHAKVLIAGENFGCGSSREHAVWAIQELGIEAIIAPSFADIFSNNASKNGLVLIEQEKAFCQILAADAEHIELFMTIDLINNQAAANDHIFQFSINPFFQYCLTEGHSEIDYLISHSLAIKTHKNRIQNTQLFTNTAGFTA